MADKKPLTERIVEAFREHGDMTLEQLAKRADTSIATLYTMMGSLKKKHGIARLRREGTGPSTYGFASKSAPPQRKPQKPKKRTPTKRLNGSGPYALALHGLHTKRAELAVELEKVDGAIKAIEALTA